ncbi:MAG: hypothetical protein QG671_2718 [Actinomycetota bacterium]|nr:hypothetical protein [Actinomycetota bacterium]
MLVGCVVTRLGKVVAALAALAVLPSEGGLPVRLRATRT